MDNTGGDCKCRFVFGKLSVGYGCNACRKKILCGSNKTYKQEGRLEAKIAEAVKGLLYENNLLEKHIEVILVSGMLTSEYGILEVEHIPAPAGIAELHNGMVKAYFPRISDIQFFFVPGVKVCGDSVDMMRGEETELMGVISSKHKKALYVLPGSHSKLITTDEHGKITDFCTMMTGEMASALSEHTILNGSVSLKEYPLAAEKLLLGYDTCLKKGINYALFQVRTLKKFFDYNAAEIYSFFIGAVLCSEVKYIAESPLERVVIGGQKVLKKVECELLRAVCDKEIIELSDSKAENSVTKGIISIYEFKD